MVAERVAYKPEEVAALLGVSRMTVFRLIGGRTPQLRSFRAGRLRLIPRKAIEEFVNRKLAEGPMSE
jgi:excisionase family DNA binding protein